MPANLKGLPVPGVHNRGGGRDSNPRTLKKLDLLHPKEPEKKKEKSVRRRYREKGGFSCPAGGKLGAVSTMRSWGIKNWDSLPKREKGDDKGGCNRWKKRKGETAS